MTSVPRAIGKSIHSNDQTAFCELMVRPKGRRPDQRALAVRLKKLQSFVAKYVGGERGLDVVEFIRISRALDADPLKLFWPIRRANPRAPKQAPSGTAEVRWKLHPG
jgi:hypothetical protein